MSHPDPLYDEENTMSQDSFDRFDEMAERTIWPWVDDAGQEWDVEDHDDFHYGEDISADDIENMWEDKEDESMDGDFDSAMRDAGFGTDEDYGHYGEDY